MSEYSASDSQPYTILIVDDMPTNLAVVVEHLEDHGFRVAVARDGKEGLKRAKFLEPDLILLDVMMPEVDGFETCRRLKAAEVTKHIPVIFMTALEDAADKLTGFDAGGADYITKPFQIAELLARINIHLALCAIQTELAQHKDQLQAEMSLRQNAELALRQVRGDIDARVAQRTADIVQINAQLTTEIAERLKSEQALQEAREELKRQASYDVLTGLPNRNLLMDRLSHALALARRSNYSVAVVFIDLDQFKFINDSLGHQSGDKLLTTIAERLKSCLRKSDTIARLSGDEFVLALSDQNNPESVANHLLSANEGVGVHPPIGGALQRMLDAVSEPVVLGEREISVTCSMGVSFFPYDGQDPEALLKNANAAMHRAKEKGRNHFQLYTAEMNARIAEQLSLEVLLRRALERNEFTLHYQPKVDLATGSISSVEALLRWNNPEKGIIPPVVFIPILERTGLIREVGKWVIQQALADQTKWQAAGLPAPRVAVNVSQIQLDQKDFVEVVKRALEKREDEATFLDLEITESLMMRNAETNVPKLKIIREMGIGVAIDDFGTGYSSLSHLGDLPVNVLKIDRAFIANITNSDSNRNIVITIIALAHSLGLKVVAEGVETTEQLELLSSLNCDEIQGYVITRPLPLEKYLAWEKGFSFSPVKLGKVRALVYNKV
ncbi:MAG: EAL domain-containing protein [Pseudomonadota bacterium]